MSGLSVISMGDGFGKFGRGGSRMGINHKRRGKVTFSQKVGVVGIGAGTPLQTGKPCKEPRGRREPVPKICTGEEKSRGESGQVE